MSEHWLDVGRPGHLGSRRRERVAEWDATYGPGRWRLVWRIGSAVHPWHSALARYEDAYHRRLSEDESLLRQLVTTARDVYDISPEDVAAGLDYSRQRPGPQHLQDIAVRRVLGRLGVGFAGADLVRLRREGAAHPSLPGARLDSGAVAFHRPDLIMRPELTGWWDAGSVEAFYQSNRYLQRASGTTTRDRSRGSHGGD
ncbi:hypothetical protein [Micromonospora sp. NBC_01412]|uniref:hypothetical protein n=1 Tax=Micromonospora sp. NBC_01412 TaxID=2903590 RepID=UPI003250A758